MSGLVIVKELSKIIFIVVASVAVAWPVYVDFSGKNLGLTEKDCSKLADRIIQDMELRACIVEAKCKP